MKHPVIPPNFPLIKGLPHKLYFRREKPEFLIINTAFNLIKGLLLSNNME